MVEGGAGRPGITAPDPHNAILAGGNAQCPNILTTFPLICHKPGRAAAGVGEFGACVLGCLVLAFRLSRNP